MIGFGIGSHVFGDPSEAYSLQMLQRTYKKEFSNYKTELYYT
jgi:hypothetical protein